MNIYKSNENGECLLNELAEVREFLQLLAVININDIPKNSINNLAGILLQKVDLIEDKLIEK